MPLPAPLPAPAPESKKPSLWPIVGASFIIQLGLFYLILKSEFLKLYTPKKTSMLIKGLYAFAALFCIFTAAVAFVYKDYLYLGATGVGAALTGVYAVFKEKIARFFFYKYII
jgi:hypothetical protein